MLHIDEPLARVESAAHHRDMSCNYSTLDTFRQWQEDRHAYVTAPTGNLALVAYQPVTTQETPVEGMPVVARRDGDLIVIRATGEGVAVDGAPVAGEVTVAQLRPDGTPLISAGHMTADVFSLDGSDYELRIYDAHAPGLENFERIDYFAHDPAMSFDGRLLPYADVAHVPWDFTRSSDSGHTKRVPGVLRVEIVDAAYDMLAFTDTDTLVLVFADATTGPESYAPGRFLKMDPPDDGNVTVDFNRAIIPPCGFSDFFSCPIPPAANRIAASVRAGEKNVVWKTPRY